jgi:hypothetical protein
MVNLSVRLHLQFPFIKQILEMICGIPVAGCVLEYLGLSSKSNMMFWVEAADWQDPALWNTCLKMQLLLFSPRRWLISGLKEQLASFRRVWGLTAFLSVLLRCRRCLDTLSHFSWIQDLNGLRVNQYLWPFFLVVILSNRTGIAGVKLHMYVPHFIWKNMFQLTRK